MKNKRMFLSVLVVFMLMLLLFTVACGSSDTPSDPGNNNNNNNNTGDNGNGNNNDNNQTLTFEEQVAADKKVLTDSNFTFEYYDATNEFFIRALEDQIKTERNSLAGVIGADSNSTSRGIRFYYFVSEEAAKKCYDENWSNNSSYFLMGIKIYYDSASENIFENPINDNGNTSATSLTDDEIYKMMSYDYDLIHERGGYYIGLEYGTYNTYLNSYIPGLGIDRDDIYGILSASSTSTADSIIVYYFRSEALAQKWYNQIWSSYEGMKVVGTKVVSDSAGTNIIH